MFGSVGGPEIVLIFIVALLVFGPKRLPEIGRKIRQVIGEIRRATGELRSNVEREIGVDPLAGLQEAGKARRELITSISDPIREAARGTLEAVAEAPRAAAGAIARARAEAEAALRHDESRPAEAETPQPATPRTKPEPSPPSEGSPKE